VGLSSPRDQTTHEIEDLSQSSRPKKEPRESQQEASKEASLDFSRLLQTCTGLLTLLGIGLYGAIRFGQQQFYDSLGSTPEEVGLTYGATLSRAAAVSAAIMTALVVVASQSAITARWSFHSWFRMVLTIVLWVALLLFTLIATIVISALALGWIGVVIFGIGVFAIFVTQLMLDRKGVPIADQILRNPATALSAVALIALMAFMVCGVIGGSSAQALKGGKEVTAGGGAYRVLGLRGEHVKLSKLSGKLPSYFDVDTLIYLGRSENTIILFNYGVDDLIRIPADGIIVLPNDVPY
jgi:hypothetical protein